MKSFNKRLEIINIFCNRCGETCAIPDGDDLDYYGIVEQAVEGKSNSAFLEDGTRYSFSLCEKCTSLLFNNFKHPPKKQIVCLPLNGQIATEREMARIYDIIDDMEKNHNVPTINAKMYGSLAASNISNSLTLLLGWPNCKIKLELINLMEKYRLNYEVGQVKSQYAEDR